MWDLPFYETLASQEKKQHLCYLLCQAGHLGLFPSQWPNLEAPRATCLASSTPLHAQKTSPFSDGIMLLRYEVAFALPPSPLLFTSSDQFIKI